MIGNEYLLAFFNAPEENYGLNSLIESLMRKDEGFLTSLKTPIDFHECTEAEMIFLTKASALIDYYLQTLNLPVPRWLRDPRLVFSKPYFHPKRISDFDKLRLQIESPGPFKARNVYFDLQGIRKV